MRSSKFPFLSCQQFVQDRSYNINNNNNNNNNIRGHMESTCYPIYKQFHHGSSTIVEHYRKGMYCQYFLNLTSIDGLCKQIYTCDILRVIASNY